MTTKYIWHDELGEPPRAKIRDSGEIIELSQLEKGALMEFPYYLGVGPTQEVIIYGETKFEYHVDTCRRAEDGIGIEMISRGQAGRNWQGNPFHTIKEPDDAIDQFLFQGKGYEELNKLLQKYHL
jgi:hypothetical protein